MAGSGASPASKLERIPDSGLPTFDSSDFDAHVIAWKEVHDQLEERLWMLGAIAASLTRNYGDAAIPEFASSVGYSPRRVWELSATYQAWQHRDRAHDLSLKHHTIAAREDDPEAAIEVAIQGDGTRPYSTREFEEALEERRRPSEVPAEVISKTRVCPACGGSGEVPAG